MGKRVLFTINNLKSAGMKGVLVDLAICLQERGLEPRVAVGKLTSSRLERKLLGAGIPVLDLRLKLGPNESIVSWLRRGLGIRKWLRQEIDIVHSFDYGRSYSEGLLVRVSGCPWLVEKTNLIYGRRWIPRLFFASKIVCLSRAQRTLLRRPWSRKLEWIPTGVNVSRYTCAESIDRAAIGIPRGGFVFVSVAHLVPVKGHPLLFQAFSRLARLSNEVFLVCAGTGDEAYQQELRELIAGLMIHDSVRMLGDFQDIPGLLALSDAFVLSTRNHGRREGFGAAIVEAMAAGLPVIATRSGGPEDIILPDETGWLVADNEAEIFEAMDTCFRDDERRLRFGRASQNRAVCKYGMELMVSRYVDLYESIADSR